MVLDVEHFNRQDALSSMNILIDKMVLDVEHFNRQDGILDLEHFYRQHAL